MSSSGDFVLILNREIPRELFVRVLSYLSKEDLRSVALVSKQFRELAYHPSLKSRLRRLASLPPLSTVMESLPFPPPAALQTTLPASTPVAPVISITEDSTITVPVIPESIPLIAKVPDVVETEVDDKDKPVVEISQVLPGYAPSYAHDYVPPQAVSYLVPQVNGQAMATFANTISFNVSRYPTLTEITDSKEYTSTHKKDSDGRSSDDSAPPEKKSKIVSSAQCTTQLEYIPAEYGRSDYVGHIVTVSAAQAVSIVNPEVLASGRLLTQMTPEIRKSSSSSGDQSDEQREEEEEGEREEDGARRNAISKKSTQENGQRENKAA